MFQIPPKQLASGGNMPALGLGTWQLKGKECVESVGKALQLGYRHIDTAEKYDNEAEIGKAIKGFPREKLFITSKVSAENLEPGRLFESLNSSLAKLQTDYLDLYLIHWPGNSTPVERTFEAFKQAQESGKIREAGISNFFIHHLDSALPAARKVGLAITVNQVEFHPLLNDAKLLEYCRENGLLVTAYSPLARGKALKNAVIREVAAKHGKTPAQISLKWAIQKGAAAIPKSASASHLEENINIFDFNLDEEDTGGIDAIKAFERLVSVDTS